MLLALPARENAWPPCISCTSRVHAGSEQRRQGPSLTSSLPPPPGKAMCDYPELVAKLNELPPLTEKLHFSLLPAPCCTASLACIKGRRKKIKREKIEIHCESPAEVVVDVVVIICMRNHRKKKERKKESRIRSLAGLIAKHYNNDEQSGPIGAKCM